MGTIQCPGEEEGIPVITSQHFKQSAGCEFDLQVRGTWKIPLLKLITKDLQTVGCAKCVRVVTGTKMPSALRLRGGGKAPLLKYLRKDLQSMDKGMRIATLDKLHKMMPIFDQEEDRYTRELKQ